MDGGAWWAAVHGVAKSRTWLSNFTFFTFHFHALEREMATHSSVLAWRIPGTGEPGGLPFMGSHRVGHDWSNLVAAAAAETRDNKRAFHTSFFIFSQGSLIEKKRDLTVPPPVSPGEVRKRHVCLNIFDKYSLKFNSLACYGQEKTKAWK